MSEFQSRRELPEESRPTDRVAAPTKPVHWAVPGHAARPRYIKDIRRLQQSLGNWAVARLLESQIQRQEPSTEPTAGTWQPPFDLPAVTSREEAGLVCWEVWRRFNNLGFALRNADLEEPEEMNALAEEATLRYREFQSRPDDNLSAQDAEQLDWFGEDVDRVHDAAVSSLRRAASDPLESIANAPLPDTSAEESRLAEQMHFAFIEGGEDTLGEIRDVLSKIKDYNDSVSNMLTWASRGARLAGSARTLSQLERAMGGASAVGDALEKVTAVATAARSLATISGLDNQAAGEAQNSIRQFEAGIELIDTGFTFFKAVPVLGQLWSNYYMPMAQACIQLIGVIARHRDVQGRQLAVVDFWQQQMRGQRQRGRAPRIPSYLLSYFPGGQSMLNYVYAIMHGRSPRPSTRVRNYFLEHRELFNAGRETRSELESESTSDWYNPATWGDERLTTDLTPWVQRNRNAVWAMLYGNLEPNL